MLVTNDMRDAKGKLPAFTIIGCYTLLYLHGGVCLCADCASEAKGSLEVDTFDEGESIPCEECGEMIESSYGPV